MAVNTPLKKLSWCDTNDSSRITVLTWTGKKLAVLLQWRDELPQNTAIRVQDFQDGAALQFSLSGKYGFLGMGEKENPVNLWRPVHR